MKTVAATAYLTGLLMLLIREPFAAGVAISIGVIFTLAILGDNNTWHRH